MGIGWYAVIILGPMVMVLVESGINLVLIGGSWGERLPTVFTDPIGTSFLLLSSSRSPTGSVKRWVGGDSLFLACWDRTTR
jgi:hypothetical protein